MKIVNARSLIRKLRGGAQSHLMECDDARFYVVKFRNNPQQRRILVNEWVSAVVLRYLGISTPKTAMVNLSQNFLESNPDVFLQLGSHREVPGPGLHFGSLYPGDPSKLATYAFMPDVMLDRVVNLRDFLGVFVFDKWMGNTDARQSIFFRAKLHEWLADFEGHPAKLGFVVQMIDQGYVFNGPHWDFRDSPLNGLYFRSRVYEEVSGYSDFEPWLDRVIEFPQEVVGDALKRIPPEWIEGDEQEVERLMTRLMSRRSHVPDLIRECSASRNNPFPNWKNTPSRQIGQARHAVGNGMMAERASPRNVSRTHCQSVGGCLVPPISDGPTYPMVIPTIRSGVKHLSRDVPN